MSKFCLLLAIFAIIMAVAYSQRLYCGYSLQLPHTTNADGTIFTTGESVQEWIDDNLLKPCKIPPVTGAITDPQTYFGLQCRYDCTNPTGTAATALNVGFLGIAAQPWVISAVCVNAAGVVVADALCVSTATNPNPPNPATYERDLINRLTPAQCPTATCGPVTPTCGILAPTAETTNDFHPTTGLFIHEYSRSNLVVPTPTLAANQDLCPEDCTTTGINIECDDNEHFVAIPEWANQYCIRDITVTAAGWDVPDTHFYNPATTPCERDAVQLDELECTPEEIGAAVAALAPTARVCEAHGHQICAQSTELLDQFALSQQNTATYGVNLPRGVGFCADDAGWVCDYEQDVDQTNCVNGQLRAFQTRVSRCGTFIQRIFPVPAVNPTGYFIGDYYQPTITPTAAISAQCAAEGTIDTERVAPQNACDLVVSDTITCPTTPTNPSPSCCKKQNVAVSDVNSGDNSIIIVNGGRTNQGADSLTAGAGAGSSFSAGATGPLGLGLGLSHTVGAAAGVEIIRNIGL